MTTAGWMLITCSWGAIIGLALFCFYTMSKSGKL